MMKAIRKCLLAATLIMAIFVSACNSGSGEKTEEPPNIVGTWRAATGSTVYFSDDGTGKTEDDYGIHEFAWEVVSMNDVMPTRREFRVRQFYGTLSDSAKSADISWGSRDMGNPTENRPDEWGMGDYVVALTFNGTDSPFDFAFTMDGRDTMIINAMDIGQILSPQPNTDMRFEWIAFTKES